MSVGFRQDINGLRAWAVMAVVLFHFELLGLTGGFVGVDVFFVISGFLMTGIMVRGLRQGDFSFWDFMGARVRRIVPALMALCVFLLAFGWWLLENNALKLLVRQIWSSVVFFSNFRFWKETGYFDQMSHDKLLLHSWSLSNEWQFYLLLPLLLMLVWKLGKNEKSLLLTIVVVFASSLATSIFLSARFPAASFYLLPARAWEMMAGGLVFFALQRWQVGVTAQKTLGWVAFAVIGWCFFFTSAQTAWPGYWAILPVAATALLIFCNGNFYLLENPVAQWLGKNSYSIYLWHWPMVVIMNYGEDIAWPLKCAFVIGSVILGAISFRWIEMPGKVFFKKGRVGQWRWCVVFGSFLLVSFAAYKNIDSQWRISGDVKVIYDEFKNTDKCAPNEAPESTGCRYGGEKIGLILIGDSHAAAVARSVSEALPSPDLHLLDLSQGGCATLEGLQYVKYPGWDCYTSHYLAQVKAAPAGVPVLMVNRYPMIFHGQNEKAHVEPETFVRTLYADDPHVFAREVKTAVIGTACEIAKDRPVFMMRMIPEMRRHVPSMMGRGWRIFGEKTRVSITEQEYLERTRASHEAQDEAAEQCGIKILDPTPYLCSDGHCWGDVDGQPIYFDDDHLSRRGADLLIPEFQKIFTSSLPEQGR